MSSSRNGLEDGYSLLELLMTIAVIGIVSGLGFVAITHVLPTVRADASLQLVTSQLRLTRQNAVDQRRTFAISFPVTHHIVVTRLELDGSTTSVSDTPLSGGMAFMLFDSLPDTPDNFGKTAPVNFGGGRTLYFRSDGSATDGSGNFVNGTVFMGAVGKELTARAVTVMGGTGRIRGYRYNGTSFN